MHAHGHRRRRPSGEPPPLPREINRAAYAWLAAFAFFVVIWLSIFLSDGPARVITEWDLAVMDPLVEDRAEWLSSASRIVNGFATHWLTPILAWSTLLVALWFRRVRHVLLLIAALSLINGTVNLVAAKGDATATAGGRDHRRLGGIRAAVTPDRSPRRGVRGGRVQPRTSGAATNRLHRGGGRSWWWWASLRSTPRSTTRADVLAGATVGVAFALLLYLTVAPDAVFPISYGKAEVGPSRHHRSPRRRDRARARPSVEHPRR